MKPKKKIPRNKTAAPSRAANPRNLWPCSYGLNVSTIHKLMSRHQNSGENINVNTSNKFFKMLSKIRYLGRISDKFTLMTKVQDLNLGKRSY